MLACKNPEKIGAMDTADCRMPFRLPSSPVAELDRQLRLEGQTAVDKERCSRLLYQLPRM